jgi:Ca2+-binding EF-hand superfamily protein
LFSNYDSDSDGNLTEDDFIRFYTTCCSGDKLGTVRENLRAFNVRHDLIKWSDIKTDGGIPAHELPRYLLSKQE